MLKYVSFFSLVLLFTSCKSLKQNEVIYWINSSKTECSGVGEMACLQIQKTDSLDLNGDWDLFYSQIEGFKYVPGFIYKLKVKETPIENPPADASSVKYSLVKELEKYSDPRLVIHDIWVLESIGGVVIDKNNIDIIPQIELNITEMKIFGSNGCNRISGAIKKVSDKNIEFSPLMETRKMCPNMEIPMQFSSALAKTKFYAKEQQYLKLFDADMIQLIALKKVD